MMGADGVLRYRYHKINLVPFGEFVPFHSLLTLGGRYAARLTENVSDFTPGEDLVLGELPGGHRFGAFICYEAIYPDLISGFAGNGAELLVNITNDAWYGTTSAPHQHFAMASLRAVETGRYLVRAANTGITAVVDARGRVLERTGLFVPAALVRDVPFVSATTFYTRHGDLLAWTCASLFAAALLASLAGPRAAGRPLQ
jgi:apolipoprotein N-acyltransferase